MSDQAETIDGADAAPRSLNLRSLLDQALDRKNNRPIIPVGNKFADVPDELSRASISTDPGIVTGLPGYDDDTQGLVAGIVEALKALHGAQDQIIAAREAARSDPTLNDAAQVLKVAAFAEGVSDRATRRMDAAYAALVQTEKSLDAELRRPVASAATGPFTSEVRAHVKGLSNQMRLQFVQDAIARGDALALGAVLGAPPYLSGLTQEFQAAMLEQHNMKRDPLVHKRLTFVRSVLEKARQAGSAYLGARESIIGTRYSTIQVLKEQQQNAAARFAAAGAA
jgi:hypothetical protein